MLLYKGRELIGDDDIDCGGGIDSDETYKGSTEPVLVSPSDSYSDEERILVGDNRHSSCPVYTIY